MCVCVPLWSVSGLTFCLWCQYWAFFPLFSSCFCPPLRLFSLHIMLRWLKLNSAFPPQWGQEYNCQLMLRAVLTMWGILLQVRCTFWNIFFFFFLNRWASCFLWAWLMGIAPLGSGRERNRIHSCDRVCDLTALQLVSHWVSFEYQASWQRRVSPLSILGLFLTICAQSLTGLFTVNCLVRLPAPSFCWLAQCIAMRLRDFSLFFPPWM